jgi:predicted GNAT family N-acyltransferase
MLYLSPSRSLAPASTVMLLAPDRVAVPGTFNAVNVDAHQHERLLHQMQRLRGRVYLEDGAISADDLTGDGRHVQAADDHSWHVLAVQPDGEVVACMRYRQYQQVEPEALGVWRSALARSATWSRRVRTAIESEIAAARKRRIGFAEFGGWAVARHARGSRGATTVLWTYAVGECLGSSIGVATATVRNCSAQILKRVGGRPLQDCGESLPAYFDPRYGCDMELLRFDTTAPARKYRDQIDRLKSLAAQMPVVCASPVTCPAPVERRTSWAALPMPAVPGYGLGDAVPA